MRLSTCYVLVVLFVCSLGFAGAFEELSHSSPILLPGQPDYYYKNLNTLKKIFHYTQYPNQYPICADLDNLPAALLLLLSPNLHGRINPIGNFTNLKESAEYFFCLAPRPEGDIVGAGLGAIEGFQYSCSCPEVALLVIRAPLVVLKAGDPNYGKIVGYIWLSGSYHFDKDGRVDLYDLNLNAFYETIQVLLGDQNSPTQQALLRTVLCNNTQNSCTGLNSKYLTIADCMAQLALKPYGTFADSWSDTIVCRLLHMYLAAVDPVTHCKHLAPDGGGKCVNYPFIDKYVTSNVALFGSDSAFVCSDQSKDAYRMKKN